MRNIIKKKRYFGLTKVKPNEKYCWISVENKNGWSLGFALGSRTIWLTNLRFESIADVKRIVKSSIVFVHLKANQK